MKRIFKLLLVIVMIMFSKPVIAKADINKGLMRADYSITVNENMDGSGFVAGNVVTINNEVDGMLFAAGNVVNVTSTSDYMFAAGSSVNIVDSKFNDGFVAGSIIELTDLNVNRDLYVAGQKITITGTIGRNLFVAGDNVVIDGVVNNDLYVDATTLVINSNAKINGKLTYNDDAKITISKDSLIGSKTTYKAPSRDVSIDTKSLTTTLIVSKLISLLNMLVVGLLMILLIPKLFSKLKEIEGKRLLPSFAWGLLILIVVPIAAVIAMFTFVGMASGIIALVLYGLLTYISTIISTFTITSLILRDKVKNPYLILLIGLPCLYIIKLIPFLGGLTSFAFLCLGIGLLTNLIKRK